MFMLKIFGILSLALGLFYLMITPEFWGLAGVIGIIAGILYVVTPNSWTNKNTDHQSKKKPRTKWGNTIVKRHYNFPLPRNMHPAVHKMAKAAGMEPGEWLAQQTNALATLKRIIEPKSGGNNNNRGGGRREEVHFDV